MRSLLLLPALHSLSVFALPAFDQQTLLEGFTTYADFAGDVPSRVASGAADQFTKCPQMNHWQEEGKEFIRQNGLVCKL